MMNRALEPGAMRPASISEIRPANARRLYRGQEAILPRAIGYRAGCELDHPAVVPRYKVDVQPSAQVAVEALGAIGVGHRNDNQLKLHFDRSDREVSGAQFVCI